MAGLICEKSCSVCLTDPNKLDSNTKKKRTKNVFI